MPWSSALSCSQSTAALGKISSQTQTGLRAGLALTRPVLFSIDPLNHLKFSLSHTRTTLGPRLRIGWWWWWWWFVGNDSKNLHLPSTVVPTKVWMEKNPTIKRICMTNTLSCSTNNADVVGLVKIKFPYLKWKETMLSFSNSFHHRLIKQLCKKRKKFASDFCISQRRNGAVDRR